MGGSISKMMASRSDKLEGTNKARDTHQTDLEDMAKVKVDQVLADKDREISNLKKQHQVFLNRKSEELAAVRLEWNRQQRGSEEEIAALQTTKATSPRPRTTRPPTTDAPTPETTHRRQTHDHSPRRDHHGFQPDFSRTPNRQHATSHETTPRRHSTPETNRDAPPRPPHTLPATYHPPTTASPMDHHLTLHPPTTAPPRHHCEHTYPTTAPPIPPSLPPSDHRPQTTTRPPPTIRNHCDHHEAPPDHRTPATHPPISDTPHHATTTRHTPPRHSTP
eukprot:gene9456-32439_t